MSMDRAVEAVEAVFAAHGRGETQMPSKVYIELPEHDGDLRAMPSAMAGAVGVKWVNSHPSNPARHGLPSVMGLYILSDPATALPLLVLDATLLTAYRTGAAAAVASKHLAPEGSRTLGIIGAGVQSDFMIEAHQVVFDDLEVLVSDVRPEAAARVAARWGGRVASVQEAAGCDIVCTTTPVREPIVRRAWLAPSVHINAMGADAEGKQELDVAVLKAARVFVDDVPQASHSGEVNVGLHTGELVPEDIAGELGAVVAGTQAGRTGAGVTVFDSTGLALQDLALALALHEAAEAKAVGTSFDFMA
jgi:ornithine cyclodeaminase/alanine dehydrogenase